MKASDIVAQLAGRLPLLTDYFSTQIGISAISASGTTVTVTTSAAHPLEVGQNVYMKGVQYAIAISSFDRSGMTGTIVTAEDHDLTEPIAALITTDGANEANFNGTHVMATVANRRTITVTMEDAGATSATGSSVLLNAASIYQRFGGLVEIATVADTTHFTYELEADIGSPYPADGSGIEIKAAPRIAGSVSTDRALAGYTKQTDGTQMWLFVVLGDVVASGDRNARSDAVYEASRVDYFQVAIQPFTIMIAIPAKSLVTASDARDVVEELFPLICRSILCHPFDPQLTSGADKPAVFRRHGFAGYTESTYWHAFEFEQMASINFADTVGPDDDVAFRDISLALSPDLGGTGTMEADIDLDDTPL